MRALVLALLALAACQNPAAPAPHTDCLYTDSILFTYRGVQYAQPIEGFYHGERCEELLRQYPTRTH